ncbi:MAG: hypothetical protein DMG80_12010 [Acidobacteria bacterium]|nr:MAG: hypothetical protein DMG80_12010 [Acidobacteriota bacterium]
MTVTVLEEKQKQMRERHAKHSRTGRPLTQSQPLVPDLQRLLRRRIQAHLLLERGLSFAQVAIEVKTSVEALRLWHDKGRPLL